MDDPESEAWNKHRALLGRVAIAWGDCHSAVYAIFLLLSGLPSDCADAIFFTLKADTAQRDITRALAIARLREHPKLEKRVADFIKGLNTLAGERNAAIHTSWAMRHPDMAITPDPFMRAHSKLEQDIEAQFTRLGEQLEEWHSRASDLYLELPRPI